MCRGCKFDGEKTYEFVDEVIPKYIDVNAALKEYEKALLKIGLKKYHKKVVKLRKKFNREFTDFKVEAPSEPVAVKSQWAFIPRTHCYISHSSSTRLT